METNKWLCDKCGNEAYFTCMICYKMFCSECYGDVREDECNDCRNFLMLNSCSIERKI
jgi:hypothetical protein